MGMVGNALGGAMRGMPPGGGIGGGRRGGDWFDHGMSDRLPGWGGGSIPIARPPGGYRTPTPTGGDLNMGDAFKGAGVPQTGKLGGLFQKAMQQKGITPDMSLDQGKAILTGGKGLTAPRDLGGTAQLGGEAELAAPRELQPDTAFAMPRNFASRRSFRR